METTPSPGAGPTLLLEAPTLENEELAALRATLLAAQRQPLALKARQARLSALLGAGDQLLPYVLAASCSDPRDRLYDREELFQLRVLDGGAHLPRLGRARAPEQQYEPLPARSMPLAVALAGLLILCLLSQLVGMVLLHLR